MNDSAEKDIWNWITNYIEVNNEFYDYKFPPCPYAKSARLKGLVDVQAYTSGNPYTFVKNQLDDLVEHKKFNIRVMVFPYWMRWLYPLHWALQKLNKTAIANEFYIQYGRVTDQVSQPYFIVIANNLPDVLAAHDTLKKTNYYNNWSDKHYNEVVIRRQHAYDKHKGKNQ